MRKYIDQLVEKFGLRPIVFTAVTLFAVVVAPAITLGWGPDRTTYTQENPADHVAFNSITNNPKWGDERNFMRIRDIASGETFNDTANLQPGKKYEVIILYHNNAKTSLNASGAGVAQGAYARTEIPAIVNSGSTGTNAMAYVGATNAQPTSVYDHITFKNSSQTDIALRYVDGTAKLTSNGAVNGSAISEDLFKAGGIKLGYDSLNGVLPGCDQYSGYITFTLVADYPGFTFQKDVRLAGTKEWKDDITVNNGAKVEYRLSYKNTGSVEQQGVVMKDSLPKGVNYVAGETDLINANNPNGKRIGDGINAGGVNIGSYMPNSNAYLYFFGTVNSTPCSILVNTAAVETLNGYRKDTATVRVAGDCKNMIKVCDLATKQVISIQENQFDSKKHSKNMADCTTPAGELPTTGPAEIVASIVAVAAITVGIVYYIKSRKDLQDALKKAQSHITK